MAECGEIDEERDDKVLEVPCRQSDGISKHAHSLVEPKHLNEFEGGEENHHGQNKTEHFVPDGNGDKVHEIACNFVRSSMKWDYAGESEISKQ